MGKSLTNRKFIFTDFSQYMDSTDIFNDLYKAEESPQPSDKEGESIDLNQQSNSAKE